MTPTEAGDDTAELPTWAYVVLCATPAVVLPVGAVRALRVPMVHAAIGTVLCGLVLAAAWTLARPALASPDPTRRESALAGVLLQLPFALMALLWVGLGPPWEATNEENTMRYAVLLGAAIAVALALVLLADVLRAAGERVWSTLAFGTHLLAGGAYLTWMSFQLGAYVLLQRQRRGPEWLTELAAVNDVLLFAACVLTYTATAAYVVSMRETRRLGETAATVYLVASLAALAFLFVRGLSFPDATALSDAWYTQPGFVVSLPAVPWIMPQLLGAALLRRASTPTSAGATP